MNRLFARDTCAPGGLVSDDAFASLRHAIDAEFPSYRSFHVVGPARSGTTALISALGLASNSRTFSEPLPRIGLQVRQWLMGERVDPTSVIWANRIRRMREVIREGRIYGEKDQQIYCWLPFYFDLFKSRFVLCHRDGRESVTSLWDLHYKIHGNLYREVDDVGELSSQARLRAGQLPPVEKDDVDAMRPRPSADEPEFHCWVSMTRFEMISWYWADYLRIAQRDLYKLPKSAWRTMKFGGSGFPAVVGDLFDFLELQGFESGSVGEMLESRPGSFVSQSAEVQSRHPPWQEWDGETMAQFDRYAASTMVQFGHYGIEKLPSVAGADVDPRAPVNVPEDAVQRRVWQELRALPSVAAFPVQTILVVGPEGLGEFPAAEPWNNAPLSRLPDTIVDLVIALGVVEHAPDMDQLVIELARRARHGLILSGSHGCFTELIEHRYSPATAIPPVNQWCIAKSRSLLANCLGFASVESFDVFSGEYRRPRIGVIVASRVTDG